MFHRNARVFLATVSLVAAGVGVARLVSAQLRAPTTAAPVVTASPPSGGGWSVSPQFPTMIADAANGTRVAMAFGGVSVTREGVSLGGGSEIAVCTEATTSMTPPLAVGDYRITVKIINGVLPNTLKAFRTTDHANVPNPAFGTFVSSCDVPAGDAKGMTATDCSFTFPVRQPGHIYTFLTASAPARFAGLRFQRL